MKLTIHFIGGSIASEIFSFITRLVVNKGTVNK